MVQMRRAPSGYITPEANTVRVPPGYELIPETLTRGTSGTTYREKIQPKTTTEIAKEVAKKKAQKEVETKSDLATSMRQAELVKRNIDNLFVEFDNVPAYDEGLVARTFGGKAEEMKQAWGHNPHLQTYKNGLDGVVGIMARAFGGEKGTMTDRDIARFTKMFPNEYATTEERQLAKTFIYKMYQNIIDISTETTKTGNVEGGKKKLSRLLELTEKAREAK